jgi:hypothetical protein
LQKFIIFWLLDAAESTIEQTIHLRTNQLAVTAAGGIEEIIEERRLAVLTSASRGASYAGETTAIGCVDEDNAAIARAQRRKTPPLLPMCFPIEFSGKQRTVKFT